MCQWILKANGRVVPRRSHRPLTIAERHSPVEVKKRKVFNTLIERRWGTTINPPKSREESGRLTFNGYEDDDEPERIVQEIEDAVDANGWLINQNPAYDQIIHAEVRLQQGDRLVTGVVKKRAIGPDGQTFGTYDDNPARNTTIYEVEFPDGEVKEYSTNVIAENILSQVDSDGYSASLMEAIVDYTKDEATGVPMTNKYVITRTGTRRLRKTTTGWKLLVRWRDGSEAWICLRI